LAGEKSEMVVHAIAIEGVLFDETEVAATGAFDGHRRGVCISVDDLKLPLALAALSVFAVYAHHRAPCASDRNEQIAQAIPALRWARG
jgi:hypothetical protein